METVNRGSFKEEFAFDPSTCPLLLNRLVCSLCLSPCMFFLRATLNAKPELAEGVGLFWESKCHFAHITLGLCCHGEAAGDSDLAPAKSPTQTHINTLLLTSSDLASRCSSCLKCHRYPVTTAARANSSRPSAPHRKPSSLKRHPRCRFFSLSILIFEGYPNLQQKEREGPTRTARERPVVCGCPPAGGSAVPRRPRQMRPRAGVM